MSSMSICISFSLGVAVGFVVGFMWTIMAMKRYMRQLKEEEDGAA